MGKRKRTSDHNQIQHSSDIVPCSSGMELLSEENGLHAIDSSELKPLSSVLDIADSSMKLQNAHYHHHHHHPSSTGHHHQNLSRSLFLKRSRHHYAHQYSRRGSVNLANASTSRGKGTSLRDDKLSFKAVTQSNSELMGRHSEFREKTFFEPERIRSCMSDLISSDHTKTICVICQKSLSRKLYFPGISVSSVQLSLVAVLACGHLYHADCLEPKTSYEDRRDPPCPVCTGSLSQVDDEREQDLHVEEDYSTLHHDTNI